jgi:large subunit ribosomal protein L4
MMASAPKAPVLGGGKKEISLDAEVFATELKAHLVHEAVRAELNAARAGTRGAKTRGLVAGGRSKPWRQKGTGRARAGTTRAPHWTGGGVAFAPGMRSFEVKVNRKARRAAFRGALSHHASAGSFAILDTSGFDAPSTRKAAELLSGWGDRPTVLVVTDDEESVAKSFRNLEKVVVTAPSELEVSALVWAKSVLVTEAALPLVLGRAGAAMGPAEKTAGASARSIAVESAESAESTEGAE